MTIVPLRSLGKLGVTTDVDPFDLPIGAFTFAKNVRFTNKGITRGPIFRNTGTTSGTFTDAKHLMTYDDLNGNGVVLVGLRNGNAYSVAQTATYGVPTSTLITPTVLSVATAASDLAYTSTFLNDVLYLNRPDRLPWYRLRTASSATKFVELPFWDVNWRCNTIRAFSGVLVALNITKSGVNIPTMVKWSDLTTYQAYPGTWTPSLSNSAGENTLSDMQDSIVDGLALRDRMLIYGTNEVWAMDFIGGNNMFAFRRVFKDAGLIAPNCVVDVMGTHYVFGTNDIYKTDGLSKSSIATDRVRDFIFNGLQRSDSQQFFAVHYPRLSEVRFCYLSNDAYTNYAKAAVGCNRAAVYNYQTDTWTFEDLPNVNHMSLGAVSSGQAFDTTAVSYDTFGGSFAATGDPPSRVMLATINTSATYGLSACVATYATPEDTGANAPILPGANAPAYLEKTYIDLDELKADLKGYKVVTSVYPQARFGTGAAAMYFKFGGAVYSNDPITWDTAMSYDGSSNYKLDYVSGGRYLAMKVTYDDYRAFTFTGFDVDLQITGER